MRGGVMRLKNVRGAKEKIESSPYVVLNPISYRGSYHELFENQNQIQIEIGMGKGNFIIEKAKQNPEINFIGIEKFDSVIVRAVEKLEQEEPLSNLKLIRMDATKITEVFDREIDTIFLNFSDPWPKERHKERRLSSPTFLKRYESIYAQDAHIIMKTDNRHLFEYSILSFLNFGYEMKEIILNLYEEGKVDNISTEYELKFHQLGFPIYLVDVLKKR